MCNASFTTTNSDQLFCKKACRTLSRNPSPSLSFDNHILGKRKRVETIDKEDVVSTDACPVVSTRSVAVAAEKIARSVDGCGVDACGVNDSSADDFGIDGCEVDVFEVDACQVDVALERLLAIGAGLGFAGGNSLLQQLGHDEKINKELEDSIGPTFMDPEILHVYDECIGRDEHQVPNRRSLLGPVDEPTKVGPSRSSHVNKDRQLLPDGHTVKRVPWSVQETNCLIALWVELGPNWIAISKRMESMSLTARNNVINLTKINGGSQEALTQAYLKVTLIYSKKQ